MSLRVAVRELCEFTAKEGDLDLRFTPSPTAAEGMAGHATVVARRGPDYISELPLIGEFEGLTVSGRADGFDPEFRLLEEIKTHRGDISRIPANHRLLHWAQVKVYGWLLCLIPLRDRPARSQPNEVTHVVASEGSKASGKDDEGD